MHPLGIITIEEPLSVLASLALFISTCTTGVCNVVFALLCLVRVHLIQRFTTSSTSYASLSSSAPFTPSRDQAQHDAGKTCATLIFF